MPKTANSDSGSGHHSRRGTMRKTAKESSGSSYYSRHGTMPKTAKESSGSSYYSRHGTMPKTAKESSGSGYHSRHGTMPKTAKKSSGSGYHSRHGTMRKTANSDSGSGYHSRRGTMRKTANSDSGSGYHSRHGTRSTRSYHDSDSESGSGYHSRRGTMEKKEKRRSRRSTRRSYDSDSDSGSSYHSRRGTMEKKEKRRSTRRSYDSDSDSDSGSSYHSRRGKMEKKEKQRSTRRSYDSDSDSDSGSSYHSRRGKMEKKEKRRSTRRSYDSDSDSDSGHHSDNSTSAEVKSKKTRKKKKRSRDGKKRKKSKRHNSSNCTEKHPRKIAKILSARNLDSFSSSPSSSNKTSPSPNHSTRFDDAPQWYLASFHRFMEKMKGLLHQYHWKYIPVLHSWVKRQNGLPKIEFVFQQLLNTDSSLVLDYLPRDKEISHWNIRNQRETHVFKIMYDMLRHSLFHQYAIPQWKTIPAHIIGKVPIKPNYSESQYKIDIMWVQRELNSYIENIEKCVIPLIEQKTQKTAPKQPSASASVPAVASRPGASRPGASESNNALVEIDSNGQIDDSFEIAEFELPAFQKEYKHKLDTVVWWENPEDLHSQHEYIFYKENNPIYCQLYHSSGTPAEFNHATVYEQFNSIKEFYGYASYEECYLPTYKEVLKYYQERDEDPPDDEMKDTQRIENMTKRFLFALKENFFFDIGFYLNEDNHKAYYKRKTCFDPLGKAMIWWRQQVGLHELDTEEEFSYCLNLERDGKFSAKEFAAYVHERRTHSHLHYALYIFMNKVHDQDMENYAYVSKCISEKPNVHTITRLDGDEYHFLVTNIFKDDYFRTCGELHYPKFKSFAKRLVTASDKLKSGKRGSNIQMGMLGATCSVSTTPMIIYRNEKDELLDEDMMLRPCVSFKPGAKGHRLLHDTEWYIKLVNYISDLTLQFVKDLSRTQPQYKEVLTKLLYIRNVFPEELRICNSIFTQQIILTVKDPRLLKEFFPHFDENDIIGAVLIIGLTTSGGDFLFFSETKYTHDPKKKDLPISAVKTIPFETGIIVIGPFDKILHTISEWEGELFFLNLHSSRDVVDNAKKYGWNAYNKYAARGFPKGYYKINNFD